MSQIVKIKLPSIKKLLAELTPQERVKNMQDAAVRTVLPRLLRNWKNGIGGDGEAMPPLSEEYAEAKVAGKVRVGEQFRGGEPIRNLTLSGDMNRSLSVGNEGQAVKVFFNDKREALKAANNHDLSNEHMMKVSKKIRQSFMSNLLKRLRGKA